MIFKHFYTSLKLLKSVFSVKSSRPQSKTHSSEDSRLQKLLRKLKPRIPESKTELYLENLGPGQFSITPASFWFNNFLFLSTHLAHLYVAMPRGESERRLPTPLKALNEPERAISASPAAKEERDYSRALPAVNIRSSPLPITCPVSTRRRSSRRGWSSGARRRDLIIPNSEIKRVDTALQDACCYKSSIRRTLCHKYESTWGGDKRQG